MTPTATTPPPLLDLQSVQVHFPVRKGLLRRQIGVVRAVEQVALQVHSGETVGLVGESGCGKSTLAQAVLRLIRPTAGHAWFAPHGTPVDLFALPPDRLRAIRPHLQLVFQNPDSAMNPRMTAFEIIAEPLRINRVATGPALRAKVESLMHAVGLSPALGDRPPVAFSGGQRQRLVIARALALEPRLVIADEPVSALDVSVQAQILNLLNELKRTFGLTYLFIAHNLEVVRYMSDRIAVMYLGRIVELGSADAVYDHPLHPYTEYLLAAIPTVDLDRQRSRPSVRVLGEPPKLGTNLHGCPFAPRCRHARELCHTTPPAWHATSPGHGAACHFAAELTLIGGGHASVA
jgi:peptide/nickel transport system ATP-binding protein